MQLNNNKETILVSVIMPVFNSERFISNSIDSVLSQTFKNIELIIVDDCSTDNTVNIINNYAKKDKRIKLILKDKNTGVADSRNLAISESKGKYIAFIDSDDVWYNNKIEKQVIVAENTSCDIVYCSYSMIDEYGNKNHNDFIVSETTNYEDMLVRSVFSCSTVLLKKSVANNYSFNKNYYHEDYVYWMNLLSDSCKACGITDILACYRVMKHTRSNNKLKSAYRRWLVYRNYLGIPFFKSLYLLFKYSILGIIKYS